MVEENFKTFLYRGFCFENMISSWVILDKNRLQGLYT